MSAEGLAPFESLWERSDSLEDVLRSYRKRWNESSIALADVDDFVFHEKLPSRSDSEKFRTARGLWVEIEELYKNRGYGRSGNQIDLPRGTRVFFGFPSVEVPRNTVFGELVIICDGFAPTITTARFGNNMMDKVNLPVPGIDGPSTYDNSVLLFDRKSIDSRGRGVFSLRIGSSADLKKWKRKAKGYEDMRMKSGRPYGLLF